jgi:hypothetical protein
MQVVIQFDELNHAIANNNTQQWLYNYTGGSLVIEVTKEATYTNSLIGF